MSSSSPPEAPGVVGTTDETEVEVAPPGAAEVFGDGWGLARRYARWLCDAGTVRGLVGPREGARVWSRHILDGAALAALVPAGAHVVDIGSGAGLPGIPLALARPDLHVTLVDSMLRRVTFLDEVVDDLGISERVDVRRGRAEELGPAAARSRDVAMARAVAGLGQLLTWAAPWVRTGGLMLAIRGDRAADEVREVQAGAARSGWGSLTVEQPHAAGTTIHVVRGVRR